MPLNNVSRLIRSLWHQAPRLSLGCESCSTVFRDGENHNIWITPTPLPNGTAYHVCQPCLTSLRQPWLEIFKLLEKARLGHGNFDRDVKIHDISAEVGCRALVTNQFTEKEVTYDESSLRSSEPFKYPAVSVDDIRVITILPGSDDIHCHMEVHNLNNDAPDFAALSYTWGLTEPGQEEFLVRIDGRPLPVTSNLHSALRALRHPSKERKLWIDAICINQAVNEDKEQQLPLMGRIYHEALGVIVWLGPDEDDSDFVMDVIQAGDVEKMNTDQFAIGIAKLWQRAWFSRTWVVQEFVLGRPRIFCGSRSVSATKFCAVHWFLGEFLVARRQDALVAAEPMNLQSSSARPAYILPSTVVSNAAMEKFVPSEFLPDILDLRRMVLDHGGNLNPRNLASILRKYRRFDAKHAKDKVYGTLGLVKKSVFQHVPIVSSDAMSDAAVYVSAMAYIINVEADVETVDLFTTLPMPLSTRQSMAGLPSWVPDFSSKDVSLISVGVLTWYVRYHANSIHRGNEPVMQLQHGRHILRRSPIEAYVEGRRLLTQGFIVDEIEDLVASTFFSSRDAMREYIRERARDSNDVAGPFGPRWWTFLQSLDDRLDEVMNSMGLRDIAQDEESAAHAGLASKLPSILQYMTLIQVDKLCRKRSVELGITVKASEWITSVWTDLLEGLPLLQGMTTREFKTEFHEMASSLIPMELDEWMNNLLSPVLSRDRNFTEEAYLLQTAIRLHFSDGRKFFFTKSGGLYGMSMPRLREGDVLAFLFPPIYMAFILRPLEDQYQIVAPAVVPPALRTKYVSQHASAGRAPQPITLV